MTIQFSFAYLLRRRKHRIALYRDRKMQFYFTVLWRHFTNNNTTNSFALRECITPPVCSL